MRWEAAITCPAKINLHLEIGPAGIDGYHELLSIFHMVDLCDTMWVRSLKNSDICSISGELSVPQEQNIVYRTAELFRESTGIRTGWDILLKKEIPLGAGLGGGSSDAASALRVFNLLSGKPLATEDLAVLGARLGSDVPFFLEGPAALVTGRGERIQCLPPLHNLWCLIVDSGITVNTAEAYRRLDVYGTRPSINNDGRVVEAYLRNKPSEWNYRNDFEDSLFQRFPFLKVVKDKLRQTEAVLTSLTGSGSGLYALYEDKKSALRGVKALENVEVNARAVKMLARFPVCILQ